MFDMGAAWRDVVNLVKSQQSLVILIAGLFVFLPNLAMGWFTPAPPVVPTGADINTLLDVMGDYYRQVMPWMLLLTVVATIGTLGLFHLWVAPRATSVGAALGRSVAMTPGYLLATLLTAIPIGVGIFLFVVPGLYLFARLSQVGPAMVARDSANPVTGIAQSWAITRGNGWRIVGFLVLVMLIAVILYAISTAAVGALLGVLMPASGAQWVLTPIVSALTAVLSVFQAAVLAAIYRQLGAGARGDVFA